MVKVENKQLEEEMPPLPPLSPPHPSDRLCCRAVQMDIPEDDAQKMVSVKDAVEYIAENK